MAWYTIPKVKIKWFYSQEGEKSGVLIKAKDFQKLVERMEDLLDHEAAEKAKKPKGKI
jgi:PHD/YefM family antitoxin component YafN of YafNO toxin-antitoxin module